MDVFSLLINTLPLGNASRKKYAWEKSKKLLTLLALNVNGYSIFFRPAGKDYAFKNVYSGAGHPCRLGFKLHPGTIRYLKGQRVWNPKYE